MSVNVEAWQGLRVLIVGAAREGTALARFLTHCGTQVTLADDKPAEDLAAKLVPLGQLGITLFLGSTPPLEGYDLLALSPGVPPTAPVVQAARALGMAITSEPRIFTQLCPAPIVGITGSSGKTTTTTLIGLMYDAGGRHTWVGGNIGEPLIGKLLTREQPDIAVMELSSFQLELFSPDYQGPAVERRRSERSRVVSLDGWSPHVALITNITPNHLDRHPSMAEYVRAKTSILGYQTRGDWAVLNQDDRVSGELPVAAGNLLRFSLERPVTEGAFLRAGELMLRAGGSERVLCAASDLKLRGRHNAANVLAAACAALAGGVPDEAIHKVATSFTGVAHRLEVVRRWRGITFVNDSIATSPERAIAALRSFSEPLVLLAGGRDKHLPWEAWARLVTHKARAVIAFGEAVPIIRRALADASASGAAAVALHTVGTLEEAVAKAADIAQPGDVVLLSPGGTSFDAFKDFEERGLRFSALANELT